MLLSNIAYENSTILVTGAAGFIGSFLAGALLEKGSKVIGLDSLNDYYDVSLKQYRLEKTSQLPGDWTFIKGQLEDRDLLDRIFTEYHPDIVVNLAAQAGIGYSIVNPDAYISSNIIGFYNILEACRRHPVKHLVYASSSSIYGSNSSLPFSTDDKTDSPVSLYAATKKSDELMAHAYSKLYDIPATALRFFTVYGPAGRPDMAYYKFTESLIHGDSINLFGYGKCERDFTYIDDIIEGTLRVMQHAPENKADGSPRHAVYNIGGNCPYDLMTFVGILSDKLIMAGLLPNDFDIGSHINLMPAQPGDVDKTCADSTPLEKDFGFTPSTSLENGLENFAFWYKDYHRL